MTMGSVTRDSCSLEKVNRHVGARIRRLRLILDLDLQYLAKRIDLTPYQLQEYECGDREIHASLLYNIAQELGVQIDYFYENLAESDDTTI
jgi:transcriptional regulator with XRE-family HTH domain